MNNCAATLAILSALAIIPIAPAQSSAPAAEERPDAAQPQRPAASNAPDAKALVKTALERIGGDAWTKLTSLESTAKVKSAMGDARFEYRFIAPRSHRLVQSLPGGGTLELGCVDGAAWMGAPGAERPIDPKIAEEMAGGGDLQMLVHSIDTRFDRFEVAGRTAIEGRDAWRVAMTPRNPVAGAPTASQRWILFIDSANTTILGIDIPAPPKDLAPDAPEQGPQLIRFSDWQQVEVPRGRNAGRMLYFRKAVVEAGGAITELEFTRVAVDTLEKSAIVPPAGLESKRPATP